MQYAYDCYRVCIGHESIEDHLRRDGPDAHIRVKLPTPCPNFRKCEQMTEGGPEAVSVTKCDRAASFTRQPVHNFINVR